MWKWGWLAMASNPLTDAAQHLVATDRELQARVRNLIDGLLTEAERQLATAPPATKIVLIRTVLPAIVKEAKAHEQDGKIIELQEQVRALMISTRAGIGPQTIPEALIPTDTPPDLLPPTLTLIQSQGEGVSRISQG